MDALFRALRPAPFLALARKVLIAVSITMSNAERVPASETAARRVGSSKARRGRPRKNSAQKNNVHGNAAKESNSTANEKSAQKSAADETVADETVIRARGLLAATLRVWELKHRIHE